MDTKEKYKQYVNTNFLAAVEPVVIDSAKGATYYGVGSAIARIVQVILGNQRAILTVCTPLEEAAGVEDVTLSLPQLVGGEGVINSMEMPLTEKEAEQLRRSAAVIKEALEQLV